eukprot:scaffold39376_cov75-Phaeocystis_antarctica.AAC.3
MSARKKFNVPLPNLYGVPGVHDKADDFNRVQRGHQNMFETMSGVMSMVLVAGLKHPLVASSCAVAYCIGNYFYLSGYADSSKDVAGARYTNPLAALKILGMFGSFFTCGAPRCHIAAVRLHYYVALKPEGRRASAAGSPAVLYAARAVHAGACQLEVSRGNSGTLYVYSIRVGSTCFPGARAAPGLVFAGTNRQTL